MICIDKKKRPAHGIGNPEPNMCCPHILALGSPENISACGVVGVAD